MKHGNQSLAWILTVAMVILLLMGCGSTRNTSKETTAATTASTRSAKKSVVRVGIENDFGNISPFGENSISRYHLQFILYESLCKRVKFGCELKEMQLVGAKKVTKIDDLTYQIEMYDYIYDSAGNHITAADYVWDAEMMKKAGIYANVSSNLDSVTALGDYKVEIRLKTAGMGAIEYILDIIPMISKAAYEASGDQMAKKIITTGPYILESLIPGSGAVLMKNTKYWQKDASLRSPYAGQNANEIDFKVITEPAQMSIALEAGDIDIAQYVADDELSRFYDVTSGKAVAGYIASPVSSNLLYHIMPNCSRDNVFSNIKLREAVFYAIDRAAVLKLAANGLGTTLNAFASRIAADYNPAWDRREYFPYNVAKAKQRLAEAGHKPGELTIRFLVPARTLYSLAAQVIQAQLDEIGIRAEINQYDTALYNTTKTDPKQWDLMLVRNGTDDYCTFTWKTLFSKSAYTWGGTRNFIFDDKLQQLLVHASNIATHNEATVDAFEQYLTKNAYACGIFTTQKYLIAKSKVVSNIYARESGGLIPGSCTYTEAF